MTELIFSKTRIFHVLKEDPVSFNQIIYGFSKNTYYQRNVLSMILCVQVFKYLSTIISNFKIINKLHVGGSKVH